VRLPDYTHYSHSSVALCNTYRVYICPETHTHHVEIEATSPWPNLAGLTFVPSRRLSPHLANYPVNIRFPLIELERKILSTWGQKILSSWGQYVSRGL
jgi:hypothetical protein